MPAQPHRISLDRSTANDDVIWRYHFAVDQPDDIDDDALLGLFEYWLRLKGERMAPNDTDVDPLDITALGLMGRVHIANVSSDAPSGYYFQTYGSRVPFDEGTDYTGFRIADHNIALMAELVAFDYFTAKRAVKPAYHHIGGRLRGNDLGYKRLILPLASANDGINHLLVGVQSHAVPHPLEV